jgi:hypothetical protein
VRTKERNTPIITLRFILMQERKNTENNTPHKDNFIKKHLAEGHSRTLSTSELHHDVRQGGNLPSPVSNGRTKSILARKPFDNNLILTCCIS